MAGWLTAALGIPLRDVLRLLRRPGAWPCGVPREGNAVAVGLLLGILDVEGGQAGESTAHFLGVVEVGVLAHVVVLAVVFACLGPVVVEGGREAGRVLPAVAWVAHAHWPADHRPSGVTGGPFARTCMRRTAPVSRAASSRYPEMAGSVTVCLGGAVVTRAVFCRAW
ncbi:hypothetical protein OHT76_00390 [Streptomyces sp. NBC_00287]|uniref:hypothetical protein n=1 Tax=Streptomyces sp. NBC_00287 TaxID=2975702 RepID=UPI002E2BF5A5|nr:hypothetical protein [Streptomyces sp. NBC_00287]